MIGGGPIGLELGQAFARLGSDVVVAEAMPRILVNAEPAVSELLLDCLRAEGLKIYTGTQVQSLKQQAKAIEAQLRGGGETESLRFDAVLLATGQRPNVEGLNLDLAGVDYDERGIIVDDTLRSTNRAVFAVGDVAGRHAFTHTAAYEAGIVLRNALFPLALARTSPATTGRSSKVRRAASSLSSRRGAKAASSARTSSGRRPVS